MQIRKKFVHYLADLSLLEISLVELCMSTRIFMNRMKTEIINCKKSDEYYVEIEKCKKTEASS